MEDKDILLDEIDSAIISIIGEQQGLTASEIHHQYNQRCEKKIIRAILWSRLISLVEFGFLDMITKDDGHLTTIFNIKQVKA